MPTPISESTSDISVGFDTVVRRALLEAVTKRVEAIRAEVEQHAVDEFARRVKRAIGEYAIEMSNYYSVQRLGPDLVIRVHLEQIKPSTQVDPSALLDPSAV